MKRIAVILLPVLFNLHANAAVLCAQNPSGIWSASTDGGVPSHSENLACQARGSRLEAAARAADEVIAQKQQAEVKKAAQVAEAQKLAATPVWVLAKGDSIDSALRAWALKAGWTVIWDAPKDWVVPNGVQFQGDFPSAAAQVVESLSRNGADIRADVYSANKTFVIHQAGSSN